MVAGSFGVVSIVSRRGDNRVTLDDYRGLGRTNPGLAFLFTVFLLAQAGVPFTSGFVAKLYTVIAAIAANTTWLAIIAMLSSVGLPGLNGFVGEFLILSGSFQTHPRAAVIAGDCVNSPIP